jgi:hypothetical protein
MLTQLLIHKKGRTRDAYRILIKAAFSSVVLMMSGTFILPASGQKLEVQQGPNLGFVSVVSECGPFVDLPVIFSQPETSDVGSVSLEISFDTKVFEELFYGPNQPWNRPLVVPGFSLDSEWGRHFIIFASRAEEQGIALSGRWKIDIFPDGVLSGMKLPNGELLRIRFYPFAWSLPGGYEISIVPDRIRFFNTNGLPAGNLAIQSGTITLVQCPLSTAFTSTTTTTTAPVTTTTTLGPTPPVVYAGTVISACESYIEMPVFFAQPQNSIVSSIAVEMSYPADYFQEQFIAPNDINNMPRVFPGWGLDLIPGYPFLTISQKSMRSTTPVAGNWTVSITPMKSGPKAGIPNGELFRMRLYPKPGLPVGDYSVSISPYSAFYNPFGQPIHGLRVLGGQITRMVCPTP